MIGRLSKIAVLGLGSIGSRHVDNLLAMGQEDLLGYDVRPMTHEARLPVVDRLESVIDYDPDYALICTPVGEHYIGAATMMTNGADVFVEKPMARGSLVAEDLCELAKLKGATLGVGYMLRAYQPLIDFKERLPQEGKLFLWCHWNAPERYRHDIVAETSHEIDLALWLAGPVSRVKHYFKPDGKPIARLVLAHRNGMESEIRIIGDGCCYSRGVNWGYGDRVEDEVTYSAEDLHETYQIELDHFLKGQPLCTGEDGLAVLRVLEMLK